MNSPYNLEISNYAILTDSKFFAASLCTLLNEDDIFVPIISLPRMSRPDWRFEVEKRAITMLRHNFKAIFCRYKDYNMLAPLRDMLNDIIIPLKNPHDVTKYIKNQPKKDKFRATKKNYIEGFVNAINEKKYLVKDKENKTISYLKEIDNKSDTLVVIEKTNMISDMAVLNYSTKMKYNVKFINRIPVDKSDEIKHLYSLLSNESDPSQLLGKLKKEISTIVDYSDLENRYSRILFVTYELYLGSFITKIPVAHMFYLQSDLSLLNEFYYLNKHNDEFAPSILFVDTEAENLSSEIPEIKTGLENHIYWGFNLNGKFASHKNFKLYSHLFPYDILMVSGHGGSPEAREVVYEFKSRDGNVHTAKLIEYFQFDKTVVDGKIGVSQTYYPLEFDNIIWKNKEKLREHGISHIFREFIEAKDNLKLISHKKIEAHQIEGLVLNDGVFTGEIFSFEDFNNPIVVLNTCGSTIHTGRMFSYAGARLTIGTIWSIFDNDAKLFGETFFKNIQKNSLLESFYNARESISDNYSKYSYVYIGSLNSYISFPSNNKNVKVFENQMVKRLKYSLKEIFRLYSIGFLKKHELYFLENFLRVFEDFSNKNFPNENELRRFSENIKRLFKSE